MTQHEIIQILDRWNFWNRHIDTGVSRNQYLKKITPYISSPEIIALVGIRRGGKSTILQQILAYLLSSGIPAKNTLFINFEEPLFETETKVTFLQDVFDAYLEFFNPKGKVYLFLDEIQIIHHWERFVTSLQDRKENIKIFITGSSSKLLQTEISTVLSGRYISEVVYPLNFTEFLEFKKVRVQTVRSVSLFYYLNEYLQFGAFPRVVLEKDESIKMKILQEYYNSIVERDIILRNKIKNVREVKELLLFLVSNIGNQVSTYTIEKKLLISNVNARRYFEYLKEAFLVDFVSLFSYKVRQQIYNPKKIYCQDTGLANVASFQFSENKGRFLENVVFNHLKKEAKEVFYWKNDCEIDFVLRKGYEVHSLYNVCLSIKNDKTYVRERESLHHAKKALHSKKEYLVFWEKNREQGEDFLVNIIDLLLGK